MNRIGKIVFVLLLLVVSGIGGAVLSFAKPAPIAAINLQVNVLPQLGSGGAPPPSGGTTHQAVLSWTPAAAQPSGVTIAGTNIYRGTAVGTYAKLNSSPVTGTAFTDASVTSGITEHYIVTSVSTTGNESAWSNDAAAPIPNNPNPPTALGAASN